MTNIYTSIHGIALSYMVGRDWVHDEEAGYVDDTLDCFDSWNGTGSLKEYIKAMLQRELDIFEAYAKTSTINPDRIVAIRMVLAIKIRLADTEPADGLLNARVAYLQNPKRTIARMIEAARSTNKRYISTDM